MFDETQHKVIGVQSDVISDSEDSKVIQKAGYSDEIICSEDEEVEDAEEKANETVTSVVNFLFGPYFLYPIQMVCLFFL